MKRVASVLKFSGPREHEPLSDFKPDLGSLLLPACGLAAAKKDTPYKFVKT